MDKEIKNRSDYMKEYNQRPEVIAKKKDLRKTEKYKKYMRDYQKKDKWKEISKERQKTDRHRKNQRDYKKERKRIDPLYKLECNIRTLISNYIRKGYTKNSKTYEILGCTYIEFRSYIELKFTHGMTWENYGEWEYDHIIPFSTTLSGNDMIKLNHYTNFQPLWRIDNLKKRNKLEIG